MNHPTLRINSKYIFNRFVRDAWDRPSCVFFFLAPYRWLNFSLWILYSVCKIINVFFLRRQTRGTAPWQPTPPDDACLHSSSWKPSYIYKCSGFFPLHLLVKQGTPAEEKEKKKKRGRMKIKLQSIGCNWLDEPHWCQRRVNVSWEKWPFVRWRTVVRYFNRNNKSWKGPSRSFSLTPRPTRRPHTVSD